MFFLGDKVNISKAKVKRIKKAVAYEKEDDGTTEKLYHIATLEYRGKPYCVFQKAEPQSEEDEVIIFALDEENELLLPVEDAHLLDEVFAEFCHQYEEYENSEEAMDME